MNHPGEYQSTISNFIVKT